MPVPLQLYYIVLSPLNLSLITFQASCFLCQSPLISAFVILIPDIIFLVCVLLTKVHEPVLYRWLFAFNHLVKMMRSF